MRQFVAPNGATVKIFPDLGAMAEAIGKALVLKVGERSAEYPFFTMALTGGRTPAPIYRRLSEPPFDAAADWTKLKIFFGDERTVGPDHEDSNYRMAREAWLGRSNIPETQIFRMMGEALDPAAEAVRYGEVLERHLPAGEGGFPSMDLTLLGMGDDGHVASLFPDTPGLAEMRAVAVANPVAKLDTIRLTLTMPTLNASRAIWFLIGGAGKAGRVAQAIGFDPDVDGIPAARIKPAHGNVTWWLDESAAARIQRDQAP